MEPSGRSRWQPVANGRAAKTAQNQPIANRWQPTATVPERMVKVDPLLAKEGVTFPAPHREVEIPRTGRGCRTRSGN